MRAAFGNSQLQLPSLDRLDEEYGAAEQLVGLAPPRLDGRTIFVPELVLSSGTLLAYFVERVGLLALNHGRTVAL